MSGHQLIASSLLIGALLVGAPAPVAAAAPVEYVAQWGPPEPEYLVRPLGVAVRKNGEVLVADAGTHLLKRYAPDGTFLGTIGSPGTGEGEFLDPVAVAVDGQGNIYVADLFPGTRIQKFDADGGFLWRRGAYGIGPGEFIRIAGIAVDRLGLVFVADTFTDRVQRFDASGNYLGQFGSLGASDGKFSSPAGIAVDRAGRILVADSTRRVQTFSPEGEFLSSWRAPDRPYRGMVVDSAGDLWMSHAYSDRISKYSVDGTLLGSWGTFGQGPGEFNTPTYLALDASGNLLVSDTWNHRIQKLDSGFGFLAGWGSGIVDGQLREPAGLALGAGGSVYVADRRNNRIQKFDAAGNFLAGWGSRGSGDGEFVLPEGVAVDGDGNVWVADYGNRRVQKFSADGDFLSSWGVAEGWPQDIHVDAAGNLLVANDGGKTDRYDPSGVLLAQFNPRFGDPTGVSTDSSGAVFATDDYFQSVLVYPAGPDYEREIGYQVIEAPGRLFHDASDNLFVADWSRSRILIFNPAGQLVGGWGTEGTGPGEFFAPRTVKGDGSGLFYVADTFNNRIQKFSAPCRPLLTVEAPDASDPYAPQVDGCRVTLDGTVSTFGHCPALETIRWNWGDGTGAVDSGFPASHVYAPPVEARGVGVHARDLGGGLSTSLVDVRLWDCQVAGACGFPDHRVITGLEFHRPGEVVSACRSITVGPGVELTAWGPVTFRAGDRISVASSLTLDRACDLKLEIQPSLLP